MNLQLVRNSYKFKQMEKTDTDEVDLLIEETEHIKKEK